MNLRPAIEIWVRQAGSRRQAFYRATPTAAWRALSMTAADKALRRGTLSIDGLADAVVVPHETAEDASRRARFAAAATHIKGVMDAVAANVSRETQGASA